jgi:putative PEP-CTERM system histidine kinase
LSLVAKNAERHKRNPEFIDDAVMTIQNSVGKMNHLMAQLRSEIPKKHSDRADLKSIIVQISEERSAQLPAPTIRQVPSTSVWVYADANRLGSVIGHIIQNAQEASSANGKVEIGLLLTNTEALIEIEDNGHGMDQDFIDNRLFKPFDSTKGLTGMGIGAYECREFVTSIGGRVKAQSSVGKGTLFQIFIPVAVHVDEVEDKH